jgi:hypothetical protein
MKKYKRITNDVIVEACEFDPEGFVFYKPELPKEQIFVDEAGNYYTLHPNKRHNILPGMMLVKRASGYLYPVEKAWFEANYVEFVEALPVE